MAICVYHMSVWSNLKYTLEILQLYTFVGSDDRTLVNRLGNKLVTSTFSIRGK